RVDGVQEFPKAHLGAVQVAHEENAVRPHNRRSGVASHIVLGPPSRRIVQGRICTTRIRSPGRPVSYTTRFVARKAARVSGATTRPARRAPREARDPRRTFQDAVKATPIRTAKA